MKYRKPSPQGSAPLGARQRSAFAIAIVAALALGLGALGCASEEADSDTGSQEVEEQQAMGQISWPTSGFATALPEPSWAIIDEDTGQATLSGELHIDSSDYFSCDVSASQSDYEEYVETCMEAGFDVDYYRDDESFSGTDADGNELWLSYYAEDDEYNDYDCSYLAIVLIASDKSAVEEDAAEDTETDTEDGSEATETETNDSESAAYTVDIDSDPGLACTVTNVADDGLTLEVVGSEEAVYIEIYAAIVDGQSVDITDSSEFSISGLTTDSGVIWGFIEEDDQQQWIISCPANPDFESMKLWFDCRVFTYSSSGAVSNTFDFVELTLEIEEA